MQYEESRPLKLKSDRLVRNVGRSSFLQVAGVFTCLEILRLM
jgi:hypothetical protein